MGVKTLYEYFYKLAYGDKGADKATLVNDCLDIADAEIKANKDAKHSQNTDTHLGTVDANINMNTHKLTSLAIPSANGDSVRATTKITEANLESAIDHKTLTNDPHSVTKTQVGLSNVENLKVKLDATSAPTVNNDVDEGYIVGSRWFDVTNDKEYVCLDNTNGAAVWTETTLANIVEDTTPQLGGDLDATDKNITGLGSVGFTQELDLGSKTANFSVDFSTDQKQKVTLTANTITLTLDTTDIKVGNYILKIINGGLATLTWASESGSVYFPSGTDPSLTASGTDIVSFYFDGTNWYGVASLDFS